MAHKRMRLVAALVSAVPGLAAADSGFWGTGSLPGYPNSSSYSNISADGLTVAGLSSAADFNKWAGYRWTEAGGLTDIGHLPQFPNRAGGVGVSPDGSTIVGFSGGEAVKWTQAGGIVDLGGVGTNATTAARASYDGSIIVGHYANTAFRWTQGTGMVFLYGLPGDTDSSATDITPDGAAICGTSDNHLEVQAVVWRNGVAQALPNWNGGDGHAEAISADGLTVAGWSYASGSGPIRSSHALLWNGGSVQSIGPDNSEALGISANGTYAVGYDLGGAFIWSQQLGLRDLAGNLALSGVQVPPGWRLTSATGVVEDAQGQVTVVGQGQNPDGLQEQFVARYTPAVPEPASSVILAVGLAAFSKRRSRWHGKEPNGPPPTA